MGIQLPHNIGIRLAHFFCILNFLRQIYFFFQCIFAANECGALLIMPRPETFQLQKAEYQTFLWRVICFFTINVSFRILKNAVRNIFSKWYYFLRKFWNSENNLIKKIFSSLFQYCERTIASTKSKICSYHINYCADLKLH